MINDFEDPAKTRLRELITQAMDMAGHELVLPPERIPLPPDSDWKGTIHPDIQSIDADGVRFNFYVRPGRAGDRPVPQWLANFARASHILENTFVYVAVEHSGEILEDSCRTVGAGLVVLREGLRLEQSVDPRLTNPRLISAQLSAMVSEARERLVNKLDLQLEAVQDYYNSARAILPEKRGEKYLDDAESVALQWRLWANRLSIRLDAVIISGDLLELAAIEEDIRTGIG